MASFEILDNETLELMSLYAGIDNIKAYRWRREHLKNVLHIYHTMHKKNEEDYEIYKSLKKLFESGKIDSKEYNGLIVELKCYKNAIIDIFSATRRIMVFSDSKVKNFQGYKPLVDILDLNTTLNNTLEKEQKKIK